jgi:N-acetylneuraminate synthase
MTGFRIGERAIGAGSPTLIVAELSANHGQQLEQALEIIRAAHEAGADAIKLQTYTADTLTIASDQEWFRVGRGTLWEGRTLHDLYAEAYTPWEWHPQLQAEAHRMGMLCFSSPFDPTAVDFLERLGMPAYKVASFELVDHGLIQRVARTGRPMILSTGMASLPEIEEAIAAFGAAGGREFALLKCTSAYPADYREMDLRTIPDLARRFGVPIGLSDHSPGSVAAVAAVALGACIIEKHLTLSRAEGGPDAAFSKEPAEFARMVAEVRAAEEALGSVNYEVNAKETASRQFRRSIFAVADIPEGAELTAENIRSIRPGQGLPPRHLPALYGRRAARAIARGTPLAWELIV